MKKTLLIAILMWCFATGSQATVQRFPKPEFETGYTLPTPTAPSPRATFYEYLDVAVLFIALVLATHIAHHRRSRKETFILMLASLLYFGFIRKGCVCSVGSLQNMALALFDRSYAIPTTVVAFFVLPLIFALFYGRTFCAAVCPLGAIQDVVILKPIRVNPWVAFILGLFPYLYLGLAVLLAATGTLFVICKYDPFVGFFRNGASFFMVILGALFLIIGIFVARPYCRFFCPYGVLLNWMSQLARKHVGITPDECIQCHLCSDSCPFGAILTPTTEKLPEYRPRAKKRLGFFLLGLPVLALLSGWIVSRLDVQLSAIHPIVRLAERIYKEDAGLVDDTTLETRTFRGMGKTTSELYGETVSIRRQMRTAGWYLGIFLGLVFGIKLISLSTWSFRVDYVPDRGQCLSCARCFKTCPREHVRLKQMREGPAYEN